MDVDQVQYLNKILIDSVNYLVEKSNCLLTIEANEVDESGNCDKFLIKYQYANIFIKIFVSYNTNYLQIPPELFFLDHDDFMADLSQIKILKNWDATDSKCLFLLIDDLMNTQFKLYNERKLLKFPRSSIIEEYKELIEEYGESKIQVYVNKSYDYVSINLYIQLTEDILKELNIVLKEQTEGLKNNNYYIIINYVHYRDKYQLNINYELSKNFQTCIKALNKSYNSSNHLINKLPDYDETYVNMLNHTQKCIHIITNYTQNTRQSYIKRKLYMNEFKEVFKSSIMEYDAKLYTNASILISHDGFYCILEVKLSDSFPEDLPLLILYSIYHVTLNRLPYKQIIQEYQYNPRWSYSEMIQSLKSNLLKMLQRFKEDSIREGKINI